MKVLEDGLCKQNCLVNGSLVNVQALDPGFGSEELNLPEESKLGSKLLEESEFEMQLCLKT